MAKKKPAKSMKVTPKPKLSGGSSGNAESTGVCHHCAQPATRDLAIFGASGRRFWRCDNLDCPAPQLPYRWHEVAGR